MKMIPMKLQKILLLFYFYFGAFFTFELTVERVKENQFLYAVVFILAVLFDLLFFVTALLLLKKGKKKDHFGRLKRFVLLCAKKAGEIVQKLGRRSVSQDKTFIKGKSERAFVFEVQTTRTKQSSRKLPKLPKNASERQKIRYEYVCFVFERDKNVSSSLTPSEVGRYLDVTGEHGEIFVNYNAARYTADEK